MKFQSVEDKKYFLLELGRVDLLGKVTEEWEPEEELVELFIKRRKKLLQRLKDFRKSQIQKANWRRERWKYLRGIRRFHRSTAGKRFHRALGRFIATRTFRVGKAGERSRTLSTFEAAEVLKALTSAKTHAYIELEYYMPLNEELDYLLFLEELVPAVERVEKWLISQASLMPEGDGVRLEDDDFEFLIRLTETAALVKAFAEKSGRSVEEVERLWDKAKEIVKKEYKIDEDDPDFYRLVVGILKRMLKIEEV